MSEGFFLLSGTVGFCDGNEWHNRRRNDFVYVPPGGIHGWHNESDEPASMPVLFERREWFARHDNVYIE